MKKAIVVLSGGMDSTTTAYIAKNEGYEIVALHFNYGQRTQNKELEAFENICKELKIHSKYVVDLDFFKQIGASALTDKNIEVPTGGLTKDIPITYVPFRNGIFLSIAGAVAEKENCQAIFIGVVEEDSSGYPDCTEGFIQNIQNSINLGTKDTTHIQIKTPLIHLRKKDIVKKAIEVGVKLELTWSCYQNEDEACGVCDSCRLRLQGFQKANIKDPIPYKQ
jgi:7-cyano-7-deazaguanine synthase